MFQDEEIQKLAEQTVKDVKFFLESGMRETAVTVVRTAIKQGIVNELKAQGDHAESGAI